MKKNVCVVPAAVLALCLFFGCASAPVVVADKSPAAIISVIGNMLIPWEVENPEDDDDDGNGLLSGMVSKLIDGNNPEILTAVDRLDYIDDSFRHIVPELTGCEVLAKDEVLNSEAYGKIRSTFYNSLSSTKRATGYKDLSIIGGKNARLLMQDVGAKSLFILNADFSKRVAKGSKRNGEIAGVVELKIKMLDEKGRETINKVYTSVTDQNVRVTSGDYNKNELVANINGAVDNCIRQFAVEHMAE